MCGIDVNIYDIENTPSPSPNIVFDHRLNTAIPRPSDTPAHTSPFMRI